MDQRHIRNFCIIAHIDHGKSTLADRLIERCGAIRGVAKEQMLDTMDIERERGITIKMTAVRLKLHRQKRSGVPAQPHRHTRSRGLHLRSLPKPRRLRRGLLVVDASQGVEAQTIANAAMAMTQNLEIVPVINKIDLPHADVDRAREEIEHAVAIDASGAVLTSAKTGEGIDEILEAIVHRIPSPRGEDEAPLRALIFDSHFDTYQGAVAYVRVIDGSVRKNDKIKMMATDSVFEVDSVGVFRPQLEVSDILQTGEVGFLTASMKTIGDASVGDTVTWADRPAQTALHGYRKAKPMVFCGLYPADDRYEELRDALQKLCLNDASIDYTAESSAASASVSGADSSAFSTWISHGKGWSENSTWT